VSDPDLTIHTTDWTAEQSAHLIQAAADAAILEAQGLLSGAPLTQFEFDLRMTLCQPRHRAQRQGRSQEQNLLASQ